MGWFDRFWAGLGNIPRVSPASHVDGFGVPGPGRSSIEGDHSVEPWGNPARPATKGAPVAVTHPTVTSGDDAYVPQGLRIATAWSWRILVLAAAGAVVMWVVGYLKTVIIPLGIALLLSALLSPTVSFLRRRMRLPKSLATALVLIGGLSVLIGTLTLVVTQFVSGFPDLTDNAADGVGKIQEWLRTGPAHMSSQQLDDALEEAKHWLEENRGNLTSSALSTAMATIEFFALCFLVLFATFFLLRDGNAIWHFIVGLFPDGAGESLHTAGEAAWRTLVSYVRATVLVAFIDAVGIGLALMVLKVNFAFSLAALVFLAAFVPIVGATISGSVAVLIALVTRGPLVALMVLIAVIAVQQLEGHVLQPVIMGRAVAIHPLAVIVAISAGVVIGGIVGALMAVPIVAVLNTGIRCLASRHTAASYEHHHKQALDDVS